MKNTVLVISLLLSLVLNALGQEKSMASFRIFPSDSYLKINGTLIDLRQQSQNQIYTIDIVPGSYAIEIWAPKYEVFRDTIVVAKDKFNYSKGLIVPSEKYKIYKKQSNKYKKGLFLSAGILLFNGVGLWYAADGGTIKALSNLQKEADYLRNLYNSIITYPNIVDVRNDYIDVQHKYNQKRKFLYIKRVVGIPLFMFTSYLSAKYIKKNISFSRPIYEEKNPLVFTDLGMNFDKESGYVLSLKFKF